jgi:hypothetical protein
MSLRPLVVATCLLLSLAGCNGTPTDLHSESPRLDTTCVPLGTRVTCTALFQDEAARRRDVTATATWQVSDPALGSFLEPGVFTPKQHGEVGLSARYDQWESTGTSWFLVDPLQSAQRLYFLAGLVRDESSSAPLPGTTVEILDGYARGARAVTNENGHYRIDGILTGESFSVKAARPGYSPVTLSYRVDSPIGPTGGSSPFLDFRLRALGN